jgi:hypothetical protein
MKRSAIVCVFGAVLLGAASAPAPKLSPLPHNGQTAIVTAYLNDMQKGAFAAAYALLNDEAHAYYRNAANFQSIYDADGYRVQKFVLLGARGDNAGRVFFARETATFRDHARDVDSTVTATLPVGVVAVKGGYRIKDPGHPWRAFAANTNVKADNLSITVKKVSFFARRIEIVATFANLGDSFVTLLPYSRSILRDNLGGIYRVIETKDWGLTDKTLFLGLRLAPDGQYTGTLNFETVVLDNRPRTFTLTVAPALREGADQPFSVDIPKLQPAHG